MKILKNKIKKIGIIITIVIISALLIFIIQKSGLIEMTKNRITEQRKAEIETDIQTIIDETKQEVQENESRDATLSDLKVKLQEQGYELDETTGQVKYNGYYVTINDDLIIENIEEIETKAKYEIMSVNGDNLDILLTIENGKGIDKITASDITLECNGREKVALDRKLQEGEEYQVKIKIVGEDKEELHKLVASTKPNIVITNTDTLGDGTTKTVEIEYPNNKNLINYYSLDDGETWEEYTGVLNVLETDNKVIAAKSVCKEGETIDKERISLVVSNSLLSATENTNMKNDAYYRIAVKDEEYTAHTYLKNGDLNIKNNTIYGDKNDVATSTEYAKNMVIVKVNGNLTINEGVTLGPYTSNYGGPKGFLLYCSETLTNNGTIQNNYGAKAEGQNVYLWKNEEDDTDVNGIGGQYEYIPKDGNTGANGGVSPGGYNGGTGGTPTASKGRKTGGRRRRCRSGIRK